LAVLVVIDQLVRVLGCVILEGVTVLKRRPEVIEAQALSVSSCGLNHLLDSSLMAVSLLGGSTIPPLEGIPPLTPANEEGTERATTSRASWIFMMGL
jgi:hypothetical protein